MKEVKLAVVGSRTIVNKSRIYFEIDEARKLLEAKGYIITEIVSGISDDEERDDKGVDFVAREYARGHKIKYKGFPAAWDDLKEPCILRTNHRGQKYNALAGPNRNTKIVEYATHVLAIWKDNSPGTGDTIKKARAARKHLKIVQL